MSCADRYGGLWVVDNDFGWSATTLTSSRAPFADIDTEPDGQAVVAYSRDGSGSSDYLYVTREVDGWTDTRIGGFSGYPYCAYGLDLATLGDAIRVLCYDSNATRFIIAQDIRP